MGKIQASLGLLGGALQNLGGGFAAVGGIIQGFAAGGVAGAAITALGEVAEGLQSCIKEATASEAVWASLAAAVTRSGTAWDSVSAGTKSALLAMQATTTYSDEQLAAALERLMTFGLSYDDAMKALGKSIDFAAAKHMDLESAATLVGKAMDGNTAILKRYGVDIATSKDAAAALTAAHDAAAKAIKAMGAGVDAWVTSVTAAIGADSTFESGLAGAKDKAQYLIDQFKQGNIDLPQFTQAMISLGVPLDEAKMKGGTAAEVLSKLNEQFGGAAQAAASTYAGTQERLKNATQEVGEKIGTIFLPALASLTEGMIPVVDGLGKGVDAISAWLTEVGKMPEVQGVVTLLQDAFGGLTKYLQDLWGFMVEQFGPALTELMGAFKDLWDALSPIGEALKELLGIFGDTGNIDILKTAIMLIVLQIRAVADIIKEVAPYIKAFAQGFKDAADFVTPILTQIVGAIRAFTDDLRTIFQAFYTWLVGGSLWMDMWTQMLSIATQMIGQLLGALSSAFFEPMKTAFTNALQAVQNTWQTGWQAVQATFTTLSQQIGTAINTQLEAWKTNLSTSTSQYAPIATQALTAMQSSVNIGMQLIQGDWQGALTSIQGALSQWGGVATGIMQGIMGQLQGAVNAGVSAIQGMFSGLVSSAQGTIATLQGMFSQAQSLVVGMSQQVVQQTTNLAQGITQVTQPAMQTFTNLFNQAAAGVVSAGQDLYNMLVGGSIWPDMMGGMESITSKAMSNIRNTVTSGFDEVVGMAASSLSRLIALQQKAAAAMMLAPTTANVQATYAAQQAVQAAQAAAAWTAPNVPAGAGTIPAGAGLEYVKAWEEAPANQSAFWVPETPQNLVGGDLASYAQKLAYAIQASRVTNATLPVSIVVDGVTVSRVVEQRMISQRQIAGGY
jgi:phage-related protein